MNMGKLKSFRAKQAALRYGNPSRVLNVIAVTGDYGASTTALLLARILGRERTVAVFTNIESSIAGNPYEPSALGSATELQAALAAARKAGAGYVMLEMTEAISTEAILGTLEFYAVLAITESELSTDILSSPTCEYAVLPYTSAADGQPIDSHKIIFFGEDIKADAYLEHVTERRGGTELTVVLDHHQRFELATYLIGRANARNVTAAVAMAYILGAPTETFDDAIADIETVHGNYERVVIDKPYRVIVDRARYPQSLELVLSTARALKKRRFLLVLGADFSDETSIGFGKAAADQVTVYGDASSDGIVVHEGTRDNAMRTALRGAKRDDTVLFVGREFEDLATTTLDDFS